MKGISLHFQSYQKRCVIHNRGYTIGWYVDNDIAITGLIDSRTSHTELFYFLKIIADLFWPRISYFSNPKNYLRLPLRPRRIFSRQRPADIWDKYEILIRRILIRIK